MKLPLIPAIIATTLSASCAGALRPAPPVVTPSGVRFVLSNPDAHSVALAGSFNRWSTAANRLLQEGSRGLWTAVVPLPPGEHLFMYVVDGAQWISPPHAEYYVDDGFGAKNGAVVVRSKER